MYAISTLYQIIKEISYSKIKIVIIYSPSSRSHCYDDDTQSVIHFIIHDQMKSLNY